MKPQELPPLGGQYAGYPPPAEEEVPIGELFGRVIRGVTKRFYFPIILLVLGVGLAYVALKTITPQYSSSAVVRVERKGILEEEGRRTFFADRGYLEAEKRWFTYRQVIEKMIDKVGLGVDAKSEQERLNLVRQFQQNLISVTTNRGASILEVKCSWTDPQTAQKIVQTLADVFIETYDSYTRSEIEQKTKFLEDHVRDLQAQIEKEQANLTEFQRSTNLMVDSGGVRTTNDSLIQLQSTLKETQFNLETKKHQRQEYQMQLETLMSSSPINALLVRNLITPTSPLYMRLRDLIQLEQVVASLDRTPSVEGQQPAEEESGYVRVGGLSPVNEALRLSLITESSPLSAKLNQVVQAERKVKSLLVTLMPNHPDVMTVQAELDDASQEAVSMIQKLDPKGVALYQDLGASDLLFQARLWERNIPGTSVAQQSSDPREALQLTKNDVRQMIRNLDPNGVKLFDQFGAAYLLAQAPAWEGLGAEAGRRERLEENIRVLGTEIDVLTRRIADLEEDIKTTREKMKNLPVEQAILEGKIMDITSLRQTYQRLNERLNSAKLEIRSNSWRVDILDYPYPATKPDFPQPLMFYGGGAFFGLFLGLAIPVLIELRDDRIRTPEEIEKKLGLSVLATLPPLSHESLHPNQ